MACTISIGAQCYESLHADGCFYVDKTGIAGNGGSVNWKDVVYEPNGRHAAYGQAKRQAQ